MLSPLCSAAASESCVSGKAAGQDLSCGRKFFANESKAKEPGAHRVFRILVLLRLGAGASHALGHLAKGQAKLNVALKLSGVKAVQLSVCRCIELEKAKLNGALGEGGMQVQHVVAAIVVMMAASVVGSVALVPNVCQGAHGLRLLFVDRLQEIRINRSAVAAYSVVIQCQGVFQKTFVACHDVGQVSQGLRGVPLCSNVDVDSAASGVVALGTGLAKASDQLL